MIILVSNDDGIDAPGIRALARMLKTIAGTTVFVVAPDREQSASSHALTLHRPLRIEKIAPRFYSVDGTPTDAVSLGVRVVLKKKPDLIVSGINKGANLGEDVHYSGTVSAALEGAIMGIPSIAFSVAGKPPFGYEVASRFAKKLVITVLKKGLPSGTVLNVNVPNGGPIRGVQVTKLGKHNYGDVIVSKVDPRGRPYYWIGGNPSELEDRQGTDGAAFLKNKISITPIKVDLTHRSFLKSLGTWKL